MNDNVCFQINDDNLNFNKLLLCITVWLAPTFIGWLC